MSHDLMSQTLIVKLQEYTGNAEELTQAAAARLAKLEAFMWVIANVCDPKCAETSVERYVGNMARHITYGDFK
jgi:hypothetical protein